MFWLLLDENRESRETVDKRFRHMPAVGVWDARWGLCVIVRDGFACIIRAIAMFVFWEYRNDDAWDVNIKGLWFFETELPRPGWVWQMWPIPTPFAVSRQHLA